jgi:hypothetical protein
VEKYGRARQATDNIIWHMCFACWITKATGTHSEYVILIAFPWQQWFHKLASVLHYTYIACLVLDECRPTFEMYLIFHVQRINISTRKFCHDMWNLTQTFFEMTKDIDVNGHGFIAKSVSYMEILDHQ